MERAVFTAHLEEATARVLNIARPLVVEELPDHVLYLIRPNSSADHILQGDEEVSPEDSLPRGHIHLPPKDAESAVDFLWRSGGKVPAWIDISVVSADTEHTFIFMLCCGRFTAGERLYHTSRGIPPFQALGPTLPKEWSWERNMARQRQLRDKNAGVIVPTPGEMVAKYGKYRLENRYLDAMREMERQRSQ